MDATEVEQLHFIIPSTEFIIFSCYYLGLCSSCTYWTTTGKTLQVLDYYHIPNFNFLWNEAWARMVEIYRTLIFPSSFFLYICRKYEYCNGMSDATCIQILHEYESGWSDWPLKTLLHLHHFEDMQMIFSELCRDLSSLI